MNKILVIIFASLLIFLLVSCTSTENREVENNPTKDDSPVTDKYEGEDSETGEEDKDSENMEEEKEVEEEIEEGIIAQYRVADDWSLVPINEGTNEKVVLLTIDDAPEKYSLEMAKTLKELNAGAIFFVNGHFVDTPEEEEILKQIHDMGFVIGNHTYNHVNLKNLESDPEKQRSELVSLNDKIEEIIGERPKFFRAPHGVNTEESKKIAQEEKMVLMNWSYGYDYFKPYFNKDKLVTAMVTGEGPEVDVPYSLLKNGANLLMHDREWTSEALEEIVIGLREKGYEILDPRLIETIK
ncbi:polysaccharide deacetylase family protein [Paucisalibacillus sp. EB02]|uniref:polysaccharide deacetylase family protein n=1 Tax=Paucisalibacillus sp. EB02 TaxID=1347087 RepID=UPI0004BB167D|nr:polysaccharide deacetylase family protein [Paucisalibacillus sp. EB02]